MPTCERFTRTFSQRDQDGEFQPVQGDHNPSGDTRRAVRSITNLHFSDGGLPGLGHCQRRQHQRRHIVSARGVFARRACLFLGVSRFRYW